eukprot:gnl/TRDRNA2_/TRDRNA2_178484_c0_seq1.p1 gnl/TRDRNA2_/TRDRNA2_178484_c0~~gnl/TRDRNA2_/TRDRNA2_178484_c0_seq1.p1  ORF type:complete len:329 (+),score=74.47 gnl/TRDRNA2_/TRDRNA2_178484_c0_seq1:120-1106(+)
MANWAVELFGEDLITKAGKKSTKDVLEGKKAVLVYFSAHWCPPCRGFTPVLADAYKNYTSGDVEVVFISSDRDQGSFDGYFGEMPWVALPFEDRQRKEQISQKFGVRGIPMLVVLGGQNGEVIAENGRGEVAKTKNLGQSLALWMPAMEPHVNSSPPLAANNQAPVHADVHWSEELFGEFLVTKLGKRTTKEIVSGKQVVLVYFSAHWCPPCRGFTPVLANAYKSYKGGDVEVIFVSSDRDQGSFDEYFGEMPWVALPFVDQQRKNQISQKFGVQGIPMLVVLSGETGQVISENGRGEVQKTTDLGKSLAIWSGKKKNPECCTICTIL